MQPETPDQLAAAVAAFVDAERRLHDVAEGAASLAAARGALERSARTLDGATSEVHAARGEVAAAAGAVAQLATETAAVARSLASAATELAARDDSAVADAVHGLRRWQLATFAAAVLSVVVAFAT